MKSNLVISGSQHLTASHSFSQLLTASHSNSQRLTVAHSNSQWLTPAHSGSQQLTVAHSVSQRLTASYSGSQRLTVAHSVLQWLTAAHSSSQQLTATHSGSQHLTVARSISQWLTASHSIIQWLTAAHSSSNTSYSSGGCCSSGSLAKNFSPSVQFLRLFFSLQLQVVVKHAMLLLTELRFFGLWVVWWCCLVLVQGSRRCETQYFGRTNVTTELQSDVLLPCIFELTLLGSNKTADVAAVWSQTNITVDNVVEIKLQGGEMFWSNRGGRIKAFPKLSEAGNFSILLRNVQRSDLGLYRCELYEGIGCSIAYQELHLRKPCMKQEDMQACTNDNPIYETINNTQGDSQSREVTHHITLDASARTSLSSSCGFKAAFCKISKKMLGEVFLLGLLLSTLVKVSAGLDECGRKQLSGATLTTELQSDVMLPCYFKPAFFRSDKAEDIAVVWSQINTTALSLPEIKMNGVVSHRVSDGREIKAFPKLSSSGNFSIILHKVHLSDQGLYRCELVKGRNCTIAYQEIHLSRFQLSVMYSITKCRSEPLALMNISAQLHSDVLLPCYFKPAVLRSDKSADIAAVWSQQNTTADYLLEVKLQGVVWFWKNRDGRIKTFPKSSAPGNFSILLQKVQESDLGLYRCELFRGISCSLAYQDIYLIAASKTYSSVKYWHYLLGAAVALCLLLVPLGYLQWKRGLDGCGRELVSNTTLTTELQSDVMLPCHFETALFRSDKAQDIAVVWSKINTPVFNLLKFKIYGNSRHWVSKDRRTKGFPKLSSSENFSIILQQAQFLDQGLYHCELFKGVNCTIAYQELHLSVSRCRTKPLARIDIATELQSDVLLPCFFKPDILGSHKTADITAVWSQQDITSDNLLEVKLPDEVMFWKNRSGRIIPFPEYSESGNFSILLRNVQRSDLGLYRCELFRGHNCTKAYQEVTVSVEFGSIKYWYLLLGAAVILCLLLVSSCCRRKNDMELSKMKSTNRKS
ncbi:hypothetical protein NFI96_014805 [Prochilodus magdalenae]|nr:hypothetical protein NFI96_014805 [Prochilodus magdalenae]